MLIVCQSMLMLHLQDCLVEPRRAAVPLDCGKIPPPHSDLNSTTIVIRHLKGWLLFIVTPVACTCQCLLTLCFVYSYAHSAPRLCACCIICPVQNTLYSRRLEPLSICILSLWMAWCVDVWNKCMHRHVLTRKCVSGLAAVRRFVSRHPCRTFACLPRLLPLLLSAID